MKKRKIPLHLHTIAMAFIMTILESQGAVAKDNSLVNTAYYAVSPCDPKKLMSLLDSGLSPDARSDGNQPLLVRASVNASKKQAACVKLLLDKGADINALGYQDTPLTAAVTDGNLSIVKLLVDRGASLDIRNRSGFTPSQMAKRLEYSNIATYLGSRAGIKSSTAKSEGFAQCVVQERAGFRQKVVTYRYQNTTYAINGHARSQASQRGWTDGFKKFSPPQMQVYLQQGLATCG